MDYPLKKSKVAHESERFKTLYKMHRIEKTDKLNIRMDRFDQKKYSKKRKKLREDLNIVEKVYVLAERIRKKSAPGSFINSLYRTSAILVKKQYILSEKNR